MLKVKEFLAFKLSHVVFSENIILFKYKVHRDTTDTSYTAAAERMGRPPLRNTGKGTEVELVVSNDRRQTVRYLAEITG